MASEDIQDFAIRLVAAAVKSGTQVTGLFDDGHQVLQFEAKPNTDPNKSVRSYRIQRGAADFLESEQGQRAVYEFVTRSTLLALEPRRPASPHSSWIYRWPDGCAVLTHRPADARCSRPLGELWLSADSVAARYVWDGWHSERSTCWRSWLLHAASQSPSYVVDKLCCGHPNLYDAEESDRAVRERIINLRRDGQLTRHAARREWDLWQDHGPPENETQAAEWGRSTGLCAWWEIVHWTRFGAREFHEHLLHLVKALQADLATEKSHG